MEGGLKTLADLPAKCWTEAPPDKQGLQYMVQGEIGGLTFNVMADGGSGVNSIPELALVHILNHQKEKGIKLDDPKHPVVQLERWKDKQELSGIAGGATVPRLGAVVLRMGFRELGSNKLKEFNARFKICKQGTTEWVPIILGGRAIDCPERGGLGFVPCNNAYSFTGLGILVSRRACECEPIRGNVYAIRASPFDSDDDERWGVEPAAAGEAGAADAIGLAVVPSLHVVDQAVQVPRPHAGDGLAQGQAHIVEHLAGGAERVAQSRLLLPLAKAAGVGTLSLIHI